MCHRVGLSSARRCRRTEARDSHPRARCRAPAVWRKFCIRNFRVVHSWESKYVPGEHAELSENGHLLRPAALSQNEAFFAGAGGGRVQEFTWEGEMPEGPIWSYLAPKKSDFFAPLMSGAQRLPNGNTLICTGYGGTVFEVTAKGEVVWNYIVPTDSRSGTGGCGNRGVFFGGKAGGNPASAPTVTERIIRALRAKIWLRARPLMGSNRNASSWPRGGGNVFARLTCRRALS